MSVIVAILFIVILGGLAASILLDLATHLGRYREQRRETPDQSRSWVWKMTR